MDTQTKQGFHDAAQALLRPGANWPEYSAFADLLHNLHSADAYSLLNTLLQTTLQQQRYPEHSLFLRQQLAKACARDQSLPPRQRLDLALNSLPLPLNIDTQEERESLCICAWIYKRKWELLGDESAAHLAIHAYRRLWNLALDNGQLDSHSHQGRHAAFLLDALAARLPPADDEAETMRANARNLRTQMQAALAPACKASLSLPPAPLHFARICCLAEILYGLDDFIEAAQWLAHARNYDLHATQLAVQEMEDFSLQQRFRQLVRLARARGASVPAVNSDPKNWDAAWTCLSHCFADHGDDSAAGQAARAFACWRGKIGLGLSGGGFRASFYHLGVMARLAELDILRHVDIISSVSGGSILAGQYYLHLKKLLESKPDRDLGKEDFLQLMRTVANGFEERVAHNLRVMAGASLSHNLQMVFTDSYSRTKRLGELYETVLYRDIDPKLPVSDPIAMPDLRITPKECEHSPFHPLRDNWQRAAKVAAWAVNATSLNSAHNWQFSASSMGESPGLLGQQVDMAARYRRLWYDQAPTEELKRFRMGYAVASSSCVPGLFVPVSLPDLYPERTVELIDGGVFDNQGIQTLLEDDCELILCSDASGQLESELKPGSALLPVLTRMNAVLMDRVREAGWQDLNARAEAGALSMFYVHLKQDLQEPPVSWIGCTDTPPTVPTSKLTPYGIDRELQTMISAIRTDLDAFSEVEAQALMCSGYRMTSQAFQSYARNPDTSASVYGRGWEGFDLDAAEGDWHFLRLQPVLANSDPDNPQRAELVSQLDTARKTYGKVLHMLTPANWLVVGLVVLALIGLAWMQYESLKKLLHLPELVLSLDNAVGIVLGIVIVIGIALAQRVRLHQNLPRPLKLLLQILLGVPISVIGSFGSRFYLWFLNPIFLRNGRIARLLEK